MRVVFLVLALLVCACSGGAQPTRPPSRAPATPTPIFDLQRALDAARQRYIGLDEQQDNLRPFVLNWEDVQSGTRLNSQQNNAFCKALDSPGLDDALTTLVSLGLNWLSVKLRHKPLPDEMDAVLDVAALFAVQSCPRWIPIVNPPPAAPTIELPWQPAGYWVVIGDPNLVWRWSAPGTFRCLSTVSTCWQVDVLSRFGCNRVDGLVQVLDADGFVVEEVRSGISAVSAEVPSPLGFGSQLPPGMAGRLAHLTCR